MEQTEEEIIETIRQRAASYTPEWRFSEDEPDIGSAIALSFARLLSGTEKRCGRIREKNRIAFADATGAQILAAEGAKGFVQFSLAGEDVPGSMVESGTELFADDDEGGQLRFETTEDVYVTPAVCDAIYQTVDDRDEIVRIAGDAEGAAGGYTLFTPGRDSLQSHCLLLSEPTVFRIATRGSILLDFFGANGRLLSDEWLSLLADQKLCAIEYGAEDGFVPFSDVHAEDGRLVLYKGEGSPAVTPQTVDESEDLWVRLRPVFPERFFGLTLSQIRIAGRCEQIRPELVVGGGLECAPANFLPFGEQLELYGEVYFGSDEVLSKKGATIRLSFREDFRKQPYGERGAQTDWNWVMRKEDFIADVHTDVAIEEVIWEYWNGNGWGSLFDQVENRRVFSKHGAGGRMINLSFRCPQDMTPVLVSSREICCIRARITKISNLYKPEGNYILPLVSEAYFSYEYEGRGLLPSQLVLQNNMESESRPGKDWFDGEPFTPFVRTDTEGCAVYYKFASPPLGNPLRALIEVAREQTDAVRQIAWSYMTGSGWRGMTVVDETRGLMQTGTMTFACYDDMKSARLFGEDGYWLRAVCKAPGDPARILKFCLNATRVANRSERQTEYFSVEEGKEDLELALREQNVHETQVYVDEQGFLSKSDEEALREAGRLFTETDEQGFIERSWVRWIRVRDFSRSRPSDRHYMLYPAKGIVQFGDGRHGRLPAIGREDNVRITYTYGGGSATNLPINRINRMGRSIGFISRVQNPMPLSGGCDAEEMDEAILRHDASFRHQNRALCGRDFERMVLTQVRSVSKVRCLRGIDRYARARKGYVTLVVLPGTETGRAMFPQIKKQIFGVLCPQIPPVLMAGGRLSVQMPLFVRVSATADVYVNDYGSVSDVQKKLDGRLAEYLNPGEWEIGTLPEETQLKNELFSVPGVTGVRNFSMTVSAESEFMDAEEILGHPFALPVNGVHGIRVMVR
ncbi:MAG: hypothetical protein IJ682_06750 [Lachnospiraceae bacterium]|nr:hypothetical protein [Lachnospiraceae bacterium]